MRKYVSNSTEKIHKNCFRILIHLSLSITLQILLFVTLLFFKRARPRHIKEDPTDVYIKIQDFF